MNDLTATPRAAPRSGINVASTAVGAVVGLATTVFVGRTLVRDRSEIGDALREASPIWLVAAAALATVGMIAIAMPWRRAIQLLGDDLPLSQVVRRYFVGEIGKYVPGGVWPILGRGELAARGGVRRTAAYGSVLLSLLALYLAAMVVVTAGLPTLLAGADGRAPVAVLLLLPLGLGALHPWVLGHVIELVEWATRHHVDVALPSWRSSVTLVARYVPAWLAIGAATWAVARSLDPSAELLDVGTAAILSWVVGFLLVPVPGGIGVREAAFVAAAGSLDPGIAAAVAVVARVVFVLVDTLGAMIGSTLLRPNRPSAARVPE